MAWSWKRELPQLLILVAMFMASALRWPTAPERMPMHWNLGGEVDRYGSKLEGLLFLPLVALLLYGLLLVLPRLDPHRANYDSFSGAYHGLRLVLLVFMGLFHGAMLGGGTPMPSMFGLLVGALLTAMGLLLPRFGQNWFAGIRTPWTLSSTLSWQKTHRLAGRLFVLAGLILLVGSQLGDRWMWRLLAPAIAVAVVLPVAYSYWVWRGDPDRAGAGQ